MGSASYYLKQRTPDSETQIPHGFSQSRQALDMCIHVRAGIGHETCGGKMTSGRVLIRIMESNEIHVT